MRPSLRAASVFFTAASLAPLALLTTPGEGLPLYAARMGMACANCHFDPNGGGPRNAFGFQFAKNRHTTDADTSGLFKDLDLSNRVAETMPLYFGVDQRLMMLVDDGALSQSGLDRFGFYNMESSLHLVFQPHERLTLVYTSDGFNELPRVTREAWGMIGLGNDHYVRAGQFRVPFGLRMDDHTVASRNGFLDFQGGGSVLPYDPRFTDQGIEFGGSHGSHFGRVALTNGSSDVLGGPRFHAQTVSGKVGYSGASFQDGFSGYDEWVRAVGPGSRTRASRWGYYALAHHASWSLLGEVVAGTDRFSPVFGGLDTRINRLGWFAETDYQVNRAVNLRVRYDRLETNRASDPAVRDHPYNRYALEGEVVPVPFAEIRWTLRLIDQPLAGNHGSERQAYVQFHFSY
jgi:hypothetical protein